MIASTKKIDLSIIIVTFNNTEITLKTLSSYLKAIENDKEHNYEIIVSDNASTDNVVEEIKQKFPKVKIIRNSENFGFSKGNNIGYEATKGRYLLFSNPDIEVNDKTLPYLIDRMDKMPDVGACTPFLRLVLSSEIDWGAHRGFPTPWASLTYFSGLLKLAKKLNLFKKQFGQYYLLDRDLSSEHEVDAIRGGFFFVKREVFIKAKKWEEDYFMYGEDLDLSFQIKKLGYKILFFPQAEALHYHGLTTGLKKHSRSISFIKPEVKLKAFHAFYDSMKIFYDKNLRKDYSEIVRIIVFAGIELKRFFGIISKSV